MAKLTVKQIEAEIAAIGKASHGHFEKLRAIGVIVTLHAAEHGDCQYMTKLFQAVSTNDQYAFRQFVNNVNVTHAKENKTEYMLFSFAAKARMGVNTGNEAEVGKPIFFLTPTGEAEELVKARKAVRKTVNEAGENGLAQLQWVSAGAANRADDWDFETKLATLLANAARRHATSKARLEQINKLIETPEKRVAIETEYAKGDWSDADEKRMANMLKRKAESQKRASGDNAPAVNANADKPAVAAE